MEEVDAVGIYIPAEYFDIFKELIQVGLERAKLSQEERANLSSWWTAEKQLVEDELESRKT